MSTSRRHFLKTSGWLAAGVCLSTTHALADAVTEPFPPNLSGNPFKPIVRVETPHGVPTFTLDGQPFLTPVFETYDAQGRYFDAFAQAGTRVFSMNTNLGEDVFGRGRATWPAPDRFDYSGLDAWARHAVATRPDALIMPRVCCWEPKWWTEANPAELELWENGEPLHADHGYPGQRKRPSLGSAKWREDMGRSLGNLIQHIQKSDYADRVFGYLLAGENTEEWWHWGQWDWGYSQPTQRAFQAWLRRKYKTAEALREAWGRPGLTFETVKAPSSRERRWNADTFRPMPAQMNVVDFLLYWNQVIPDAIDHFAGIVKEATCKTKVVGAFYAFMYQNPEPEHGHNGLGPYLASPHLDFAMATSGFGHRTLGGVDYGRETPLSVQLHGKVFYFDMDYASHLNTERERQRKLAQPGLSDADKERLRQWLPEDFGDRENRGTSAKEDFALYRRAAGFTICSGMFQSIFDIAHGSYDSTDHMTEVARLNETFKRAARHDRSSVAEILVVADETSCAYVTSAGAWGECDVLRSALRDTQFRLPKIGAPHDQILLDDLRLIDLNRYKLVVFLNAYHVTDAQRSMIEKVKHGGRTVLWCYAPGLFNGTQSSESRMADLTGIDLRFAADSQPTMLQMQLSDTPHMLTSPLLQAGIKTFGSQRRARRILVADANATTLAVAPATRQPLLAIKPMEQWTSIYTPTPDLPPSFYRELARQAGVHIYSERDDTFYVCQSYACLHASGPGRRTLKFPKPITLHDAFTETLVATSVLDYSVELHHGETVLLRLAKSA